MIDTEPTIAKMLEVRKALRTKPAYTPMHESGVTEVLQKFFTDKEPGATVSAVSRMGGGASKEQFIFSLALKGKEPCRYVLRMDPLEAITETSRSREFEMLKAFRDILPVPLPVWLDADGSYFGQPALIMEVVGGVAKPSTEQSVKVTGLGTQLGARLRELLRPQFLDNQVAIHNFDWRKADLPSFAAPLDDPKQAARWQLEYFAELYRQDGDPEPIITLAEEWMRNNLPDCTDPVVVHGDYRTGNYLFDEASGEVSAILDWELAYIGDFHDDIAWTTQTVFMSNDDNGVARVSDLFEFEEYLTAYQKASGRTINRATLNYYLIFCAYKAYVICSGTGMAISRAQHNHQDVLLTFLSATSPLHKGEIQRLLQQEIS